VEYMAAENASPSPYFFELKLDPLVWADLGERDVEQAVVHSHVSSPPRPPRGGSPTAASRRSPWRRWSMPRSRAPGCAIWRVCGLVPVRARAFRRPRLRGLGDLERALHLA